jgi:hypothetical protein
MKTRDKLSTAPHLLALYDDVELHIRRERRLDWLVGALVLSTSIALAALPVILWWGELLP